MKILFLTPQLAFPPHQGTTVRNYNIIRNLSTRHDIYLVSFGTQQELSEAQPLAQLCRRIDAVLAPSRTIAQRALTTIISPYPDMALRLESPAMHERISSTLGTERFDLVQAEGIEMARYVLGREFGPGKTPLVFDDHNAEYVLQRTAFESDVRYPLRWHAAAYSIIQTAKLARYERAVCNRANHVLAASGTDARAIGALGITAPVTVVPNGVDTSHFVPSTEVCAKPLAEQSMVYAGKMDYRPNVDAMLWFCDEILPRIRNEIPLAHIAVVGQKPSPRIAQLNNREGVEVTGWVPDTRPYVADAAVYVVPLRMGSGTRLKVLEAMAMGKAIVTTSRGIEGIDCVPGQHMLVADSSHDFAHAVVSLFRDPQHRRALGQAARKLVEAKYDWRSVTAKLDAIYEGLVGAG